ncbi:hypothetical protein GCM10008090_14110 [Arenicella chitinivorans]|uniref:HTH luxR-type domain-containing protein n=1 Tax=Arenicella chitinivorans TaxID=1329800 RepID=A0A918RQ84_9GAMM|nr:helix-turn-helix transcriptional regulator [Arenicella chitinivorans]GHA05673.1 hypothetical protein GCM10008090_14110 [Arenicella chitinivorans]
MNTYANTTRPIKPTEHSILPMPMPVQGASPHSALEPILHLSLPVFLIDNALRVVELNTAAQHVVNDNWLSIEGTKLTFREDKNALQIRMAGQRVLCHGKENTNSPKSERLYLNTNDDELRAFTLTQCPIKPELLLVTIEGDLHHDGQAMQRFASAFGLSKCETRVISLMVSGQKPKQIAYTLNISIHTVRSHLRSLYSKLRVRDFNDALILAVRLLS